MKVLYNIFENFLRNPENKKYDQILLDKYLNKYNVRFF